MRSTTAKAQPSNTQVEGGTPTNSPVVCDFRFHALSVRRSHSLARSSVAQCRIAIAAFRPPPFPLPIFLLPTFSGLNSVQQSRRLDSHLRVFEIALSHYCSCGGCHGVLFLPWISLDALLLMIDRRHGFQPLGECRIPALSQRSSHRFLGHRTRLRNSEPPPLDSSDRF